MVGRSSLIRIKRPTTRFDYGTKHAAIRLLLPPVVSALQARDRLITAEVRLIPRLRWLVGGLQPTRKVLTATYRGGGVPACLYDLYKYCYEFKR